MTCSGCDGPVTGSGVGVQVLFEEQVDSAYMQPLLFRPDEGSNPNPTNSILV